MFVYNVLLHSHVMGHPRGEYLTDNGYTMVNHMRYVYTHLALLLRKHVFFHRSHEFCHWRDRGTWDGCILAGYMFQSLLFED